MSEKIEFIPAKDLPVAEGDEVDVLCVENGELKRKEGASLGGGGAEWDAVIDLGDSPLQYYGTSGMTFVSGSFDTIKSKLDAGDLPKVLIIFNCTPYNRCYQAVEVYRHRDNNTIHVSCVGYNLYAGSSNGVAILTITITSDSAFSDFAYRQIANS